MLALTSGRERLGTVEREPRTSPARVHRGRWRGRREVSLLVGGQHVEGVRGAGTQVVRREGGRRRLAEQHAVGAELLVHLVAGDGAPGGGLPGDGRAVRGDGRGGRAAGSR